MTPPPASRRIQLTIPSDPENLSLVRGAVERLNKLIGFSQPDSDAVVLAIDEALTNVIKHGYGGAKDQDIIIRLEAIERSGKPGLAIIIRDFGKQVDPTTIRGRDLDDLRPGGLGCHIINQAMDHVEYTRPPNGGGMQLRMEKYLTQN